VITLPEKQEIKILTQTFVTLITSWLWSNYKALISCYLIVILKTAF